MAELADELALLRPAAAGVSRRDDDPPTWDWRLIAPLLGVRGPPPSAFCLQVKPLDDGHARDAELFRDLAIAV